jgi:hypothetical protein
MAILSPLMTTGSLNAFYDEVVFWEMAKKTNRFFVTFERGNYGIRNARRESIGTAEIDYPHVNRQIENGDIFENIDPDANRSSYPYNIFLEKEEISDNPSKSKQNNGHITITQLKGTKFFQTYLTSSNANFATRTYTYETSNPTSGSSLSFRTVSCSYYFPQSQYQLSVLRDSPTVIINLKKQEELPYGVGEKPFLLIPDHTSQHVKDNLEYYLEKAGLLTKTTRTKVPIKPEKGGGGPLKPSIGQGFDYGHLEEAERKNSPFADLFGVNDDEFFEDRIKEKKRQFGIFGFDRDDDTPQDRRDARGGGPLRNLFDRRNRPRPISTDDPRNPEVHNHPHRHRGSRGQKRSRHKHK